MTVTVRLPGGGADEYMRSRVAAADSSSDDRSGDAYVKNSDGTLDVIRTGSKVPHNYPPGKWIDVEGDQRKHGKPGFWH